MSSVFLLFCFCFFFLLLQDGIQFEIIIVNDTMSLGDIQNPSGNTDKHASLPNNVNSISSEDINTNRDSKEENSERGISTKHSQS